MLILVFAWFCSSKAAGETFEQSNCKIAPKSPELTARVWEIMLVAEPAPQRPIVVIEAAQVRRHYSNSSVIVKLESDIDRCAKGKSILMKSWMRVTKRVFLCELERELEMLPAPGETGCWIGTKLDWASDSLWSRINGRNGRG